MTSCHGQKEILPVGLETRIQVFVLQLIQPFTEHHDSVVQDLPAMW